MNQRRFYVDRFLFHRFAALTPQNRLSAAVRFSKSQYKSCFSVLLRLNFMPGNCVQSHQE